jgi:Tol biopolymer transport system component/DNA-binding winged helix-turn-helix (wHTH) protein
MVQAATPGAFRFGKFVVDVRGRTLHKHGFRVKLHRQPLDMLLLLLEHPGEVVTREELRRKLWSTDTFVDFENSLNAVVKKLRQSLDDSAEEPRYIETVPRLGYRFIAAVENVDTALSVSGSQKAANQRAEPAAELRPPAPVQNRSRGWLPENGFFAFLVPALTLLVVLALLFAFRPAAPSPRVLRIRQLTHLGTVEAHQNLVTDGPRVYFRDLTGGQRTLEYVSSEGGEPYLLPNSSPDFDIGGISPDGSNLLVGSVTLAGDNPLWILPASGGWPRRLGNIMAIDSSWSSDGRKLAFLTAENAIYTANADGSASRRLADVPGTPFCPRWSPDSSRLCFVTIRSGTGPIELWEIATNGKSAAHPLLPGSTSMEHAWGGAWSTDGRYFFFSSSLQGVSCIWALREKANWWHKVNGDPVQLTAGPISYSQPSISRDGKALFVIGEERRGELLRYDSTTHSFLPFLPKLSADHVSFSRDGQWMAYVQYPEGTLWRSKVDGTERLQLTLSPLRAYKPRWSPDGKWIAFRGVAESGQSPKVFRAAADDKEPVEQFETEGLVARSLDWSPDGSAVAVETAASAQAPEPFSVAILNLQTKKIDWVPGSQGLQDPRWSPDGRYLSAVPAGSKRLELYDFRTRRWSDLGLDVDYEAWSREGEYIYFNAFFNGMDRSIFELRVADRRLRRLVTLKDEVLTGIYGSWSGVAPNGSPLVLRDAGSRDIYAIDLGLP